MKRQSNEVKLSDEEKFVLDIFWRLHFSQMATDYRLGRAKRDKRYYELALGIVFDNKHICKWYLETGREIFGKQIGVRVREISFLQEIADEQYKNIMGKEICFFMLSVCFCDFCCELLLLLFILSVAFQNS